MHELHGRFSAHAVYCSGVVVIQLMCHVMLLPFQPVQKYADPWQQGDSAVMMRATPAGGSQDCLAATRQGQRMARRAVAEGHDKCGCLRGAYHSAQQQLAA